MLTAFLWGGHILLCFIIIGLVLLQQGKGSDLGASFGGGSAGTLFGSSGASNFLSRATATSIALFFFTSLSLTYLDGNNSRVPAESVLKNELSNELPVALPPLDVQKTQTMINTSTTDDNLPAIDKMGNMKSELEQDKASEEVN